MNIDALRAKRAELADARRKLAGTKTLLADRKAQFDRENRDLVAQMNRENDAVAAAELMLRTLAVEMFKATGEKELIVGVQVKEIDAFAIDEAAALDWARQTRMCLLPERVDLAAVKKIAKVQPLPFVKVTKEPQPQIASDLDKAIATEELTAAAPATEQPAVSAVADREMPF